MLDLLLRHIIHRGTLVVRYPSGLTNVYGAGEPAATIRFTDWGAVTALALDPDLKLGELYMDGRLTIEQGDIVSLLDLLVRNVSDNGAGRSRKALRFLRQIFRAFAQWNPASRARAHVAHHYDLSGRLYDLFLDASRQYSCAY